MFPRLFLCVVMRSSSCLAIAASTVFGAAVALADDGGSQAPVISQPDTYMPRVGEQPVMGKAFMPNEPHSSFVLEVNPLRLLERGIGLEGEVRVGEKISVGGELIYQGGQVVSESNVTASTNYLGGAAKIRLYPVDALSGIFFGAKLSVGSDTSKIERGSESLSHSTVGIAPTVHVGYRVTNFGGFTLAMYLGGGLNAVKHEVTTAQLKDNRTAAFSTDPIVASARTKINKQHRLFRFDYGLTLGVAF